LKWIVPLGKRYEKLLERAAGSLMQALLKDPASWPVLELLTETKEKNHLQVSAQGSFCSVIHQHSHGTRLF